MAFGPRTSIRAPDTVLRVPPEVHSATEPLWASPPARCGVGQTQPEGLQVELLIDLIENWIEPFIAPGLST